MKYDKLEKEKLLKIGENFLEKLLKIRQKVGLLKKKLSLFHVNFVYSKLHFYFLLLRKEISILFVAIKNRTKYFFTCCK